ERGGTFCYRHHCSALVGISSGGGSAGTARSDKDRLPAQVSGATDGQCRHGISKHVEAHMKPDARQNSPRDEGRQPYRVRLPGWVSEEIGLGDVIKRSMAAAGIPACGGCSRRATALNGWLMFSGKEGN